MQTVQERQGGHQLPGEEGSGKIPAYSWLEPKAGLGGTYMFKKPLLSQVS